MTTKSLVMDLSKEDKLDGDTYDIWHCTIQYFLHEKELLETLDHAMVELEQGSTTQHRSDLEAFQNWHNKDGCARYTMLGCMHDDLPKESERCQTAFEM